jgi:hypothetical protein
MSGVSALGSTEQAVRASMAMAIVTRSGLMA